MPQSLTARPKTDPRVQEAEEAAARAFREAYERTPEEYRRFIVPLERTERVAEDLAGGRRVPVYADIRIPYMSVAGRVAMCVDEHVAQGKQIEISRPEFEIVADRLFCHVTVTAPLRGRATGTAQIVIGDRGVNATSPVENAITSALGRALGALGYGLFGTGIASADEVLDALRREREPAPPAASAQPRAGEPASRLPDELRALALRVLRTPGEAELLWAQCRSAETFRERLAQLAAQRESSGATAATNAAPAAHETNGHGPEGPEPQPDPDDPQALLAAGRAGRDTLIPLAERLGVGREAYLGWLQRTYSVPSPDSLTDAQLARELELMRARFTKPDVAQRFATRCQTARS